MSLTNILIIGGFMSFLYQLSQYNLKLTFSPMNALRGTKKFQLSKSLKLFKKYYYDSFDLNKIHFLRLHLITDFIFMFYIKNFLLGFSSFLPYVYYITDIGETILIFLFTIDKYKCIFENNYRIYYILNVIKFFCIFMSFI